MLSCYWFVVAAPILAYFFSWAAGKDKRARNHFAIAVFFIVYIACVCLRSVTVGADTANYARYFQTGSLVGWNHGYYYGGSEPGFQILCSAISNFGNERLFLIVCGLIALVPVAVLYYKEAESSALCCSFFLISLLFEFFLSGVRQGVAVGLGVIAFYFVEKKRFVPFLAIVALATTIHSSAAVLLVLYPLYQAKITQKWIPFVVVAVVVIFLARDTIFNNVLLPMFGSDYLNGYEYLTGSSDQGTLSFLFLLLAAYACLMLDPKEADPKTLGFRNILLLAAVIHIFTALHPVVCRMNYYFILFIPIAISRVNARVKPLLQPIEQIAALVLPVFFVVYFLFLKGDSLHIAPYIPFFR